MSLFLLNLILAIAWAALTNSFTLPGLAVGMLVGFFALWIVQPLFENRGGGYFTKVWRWLKLLVLFHYELIVSSLSVAWDVLTPRHRARPGIVAVPMKAKGEAEAILAKADAQAQANQMVAASLSPILVQQNWVDQWNGVQPKYMLSDQANMLLSLPAENDKP